MAHRPPEPTPSLLGVLFAWWRQLDAWGRRYRAWIDAVLRRAAADADRLLPAPPTLQDRLAAFITRADNQGLSQRALHKKWQNEGNPAVSEKVFPAQGRPGRPRKLRS